MLVFFFFFETDFLILSRLWLQTSTPCQRHITLPMLCLITNCVHNPFLDVAFCNGVETLGLVTSGRLGLHGGALCQSM
jgi:hypothetical protein